MNKDVLISIKSRQFFDGVGTDFIELITPGTMLKRNGNYVIKYCESDPDTSAETHTVVTTEPSGLVTVIRHGDIESEMIFEQGRKHMFHYDTDKGSMTMGIFANKVGVSLGDSGGKIDIDYAIEIENAVAYENQLRMDITRPAQSGVPL